MDINNRKNSFFIIAGVAVFFILVLVLQRMSSGNEEYILDMRKERKEKDDWFRTHPDSPMDKANREAFKGLNYFDVDPMMRVVAHFKPHPSRDRIVMPRTSGGPDTMLVAGLLKFRIKGVEYTLTAYQPNEKDSKTLFVPFRDATSGRETYGGGRYLDPRRIEERVTLDFNQAYNPYCLFDYKRMCPIPPEVNTLPIEIRAGEKMYTILEPETL